MATEFILNLYIGAEWRYLEGVLLARIAPVISFTE
jgi:hypothetical protein